MELINEILGKHPLEIWGAGLIWSLIGIIAVKLYYLSDKIESFSLTFWLKDNGIEIIKGIIWAMVIIRLGDVAIDLLKDKFKYDLPETTDFVALMILISGFIQYKLHKKRKPLIKK